MLRDRPELHSDQAINVMFNNGGLGDHIARAPALLHLLTYYPHITIHLYIPVFMHELYRYWFSAFGRRFNIYDRENWTSAIKRPSYWFGEGFTTTLGTHLVHHAFQTFLDQEPHPDWCSYPKLPPLEGYDKEWMDLPYVVVTTGYTAESREMLPDIVNSVVDGIIARGMLPVFLGKQDVYFDLKGKFKEGVDYTKGIDLRDSTSLREAATILHFSKAVMGLDNGLLHLAACTPVPIVMAFSSQYPRLRLPYREGVMGKGVEVVEPDNCQGCEPRLRFEYQHDFRYCFYGDYVCLKELTAQKYLDALDKLLKE